MPVLDPLPSPILDLRSSTVAPTGGLMQFLLRSLALLVLSLAFVPSRIYAQPALIEGAKKEGKVVWYTSMAIDTSKPLLDAFLKEYPFIKADLVRAGEEQLTNRMLSETRSEEHTSELQSRLH